MCTLKLEMIVVGCTFSSVSRKKYLLFLEFEIPNFLGAFAKLRKATISFVMFVCPSMRMEQLGVHWTDFDAT
jgi:hypothetical protein